MIDSLATEDQDGLLPCEEWRSVPEFESYYEVSNYGAIRCWIRGGGGRRKTPRLKTIGFDKNGYRFVVLFQRGRSKGFRVGRLVLRVFGGEPRATNLEASHIDGNRQNDCISNLAWETRQQNEDRKRMHGTRLEGISNPASKLSEQHVLEIRKQAKCVMGKTLACKYGMSESAISAIINRRTWRHI